MEKLLDELKRKVVETLNLGDIKPEDIDGDEQLVGGRLGIDSIDVLELVMMIEKTYGLRIDNKEMGAKVFASMSAMAGYIQENAPESAP